MKDHIFECRGRVERGRSLGRALGAPTANLTLGRDVECTYGTFAAIVEGLERPYRAVAHLGVRPSVSAGAAPILEAHLLDFDGDLYGRELVVSLEHKVADEVRLDSLDALARKIAADVASVRAYFAATSGLVRWRASLPMATWEDQARRAFRIGDAATSDGLRPQGSSSRP